jgi:hypothetical protein
MNKVAGLKISTENTFAQRLKNHLEIWARDLEHFRNDGVHPWVLDRPSSALNYFGGKEWEALLFGKHHKWGHALNSSQAFAVNLFGPAHFLPDVAKSLWSALPAAQDHPNPERVVVHFEYSGPDEDFAKTELGEAGIPTQIDVAVEGIFSGDVRRMQFIEVKLTESKFGSCRGAKRGKKDPNPAPDRCEDLSRILLNPSTQCWLAEAEGQHRHYWKFIGSTVSGLDTKAEKNGGCPWKGGLYQVMRNWVLARAMLDRGVVASVNLAVCVHPGNHAAANLSAEVAGAKNLVAAFNTMSKQMTVSECDPRTIIDAQDKGGAPTAWKNYMLRRYLSAELCGVSP